MGERDLARPRRRAAADQRRRPTPCGAARAGRARPSAPARTRRRRSGSPPTRAPRRASSGGSRPARRCASIDLPVPGGPTISRLSPPAAATSSARLAAAWPLARRAGRAAARSTPRAAAGAAAAARRRRRRRRAGSARTTSADGARRAPRGRRPAPTRRRSPAAAPACARRRRGVRRRASAMASAPRTGRSSPASESSPANSKRSSRAASSWPAAARMPSAIGRSKRPDSFGRSAGARFTVTRLLCGNSRPLVCSAARTRSRDSLTSVSARPTSVKLGSPLARCTSTVTAGARGRAGRGCGRRRRPCDGRLVRRSAIVDGGVAPAARHLRVHRLQRLRPVLGRWRIATVPAAPAASSDARRGARGVKRLARNVQKCTRSLKPIFRESSMKNALILVPVLAALAAVRKRRPRRRAGAGRVAVHRQHQPHHATTSSAARTRATRTGSRRPCRAASTGRRTASTSATGTRTSASPTPALEMDFYGGYKGEIAKDVGYDVGILQYYYPQKNKDARLQHDRALRRAQLRPGSRSSTRTRSRRTTSASASRSSRACRCHQAQGPQHAATSTSRRNYPLVDKLTLNAHVGYTRYASTCATSRTAPTRTSACRATPTTSRRRPTTSARASSAAGARRRRDQEGLLRRHQQGARHRRPSARRCERRCGAPAAPQACRIHRSNQEGVDHEDGDRDRQAVQARRSA